MEASGAQPACLFEPKACLDCNGARDADPCYHATPVPRPPGLPPARFLRPLYRALNGSKSEAARQLALNTFKQHRAAYHPIASKMASAAACIRYCCRQRAWVWKMLVYLGFRSVYLQ